MQEFLRKFFKDGFVSGEYSYGVVHIIAIVFAVVSVIIFSWLLMGKEKQYINKKIKIIAYICLVIDITKRTISFIGGASFISAFYPFYLCNINTYLLSIYIIFDLKKGKDFFIVTGFIGGLITYAMPFGIFTDKYLTFGILNSLTSHYVIIVIPLVLLITKAHKLEMKTFYQQIIGLVMVLINAEVIGRILLQDTTDYLYIRSDMPFKIPGVPQIIIIGSLFIFTIMLTYFIDIYYTTKQCPFKLKTQTSN